MTYEELYDVIIDCENAIEKYYIEKIAFNSNSNLKEMFAKIRVSASEMRDKAHDLEEMLAWG